MANQSLDQRTAADALDDLRLRVSQAGALAAILSEHKADPNHARMCAFTIRDLLDGAAALTEEALACIAEGRPGAVVPCGQVA